MADVVHRTTVEYRTSVHTPDYPTETWIINPDLSSLTEVPWRYWKVVGDAVVEMTQGEKDAVDLALLTALYEQLIDQVTRKVDEFHIGDDFIGVDLDWTRWTNDKVGVDSSLTALALDHGVVRIRSGGAAGNYCTLINGLYAFRATHNLIAQTRLKLLQTTNLTAYLGFYHAAADRFEFKADPPSGYWKTYTVAGGVTTQTTTAIALDTAWHYFEIRASALQVEFLIDGAVVATHTTNITEEITYFRAQVARTGGSAVLDAHIDFIYIDGKRSDN
jgi:hypothetical protein